VLIHRDGIDEQTARWAASVCGGHVGRARRLATDPTARDRRTAVLRIPTALRRPVDVFTCADDLVKSAETDASTMNQARDNAEREALETAMGAGGTGKGTAAATRGAKGAIKDLEKRQKSRTTRTQRDSLDLALIDLAGFYRDVLVHHHARRPHRGHRRLRAQLDPGVGAAPVGVGAVLPRSHRAQRQAAHRGRGHAQRVAGRLTPPPVRWPGWPRHAYGWAGAAPLTR
jgi:hypothetical protein